MRMRREGMTGAEGIRAEVRGLKTGLTHILHRPFKVVCLSGRLVMSFSHRIILRRLRCDAWHCETHVRSVLKTSMGFASLATAYSSFDVDVSCFCVEFIVVICFFLLRSLVLLDVSCASLVATPF